MKDLTIAVLQKNCRDKRYTAHQSQTAQDWDAFRAARNSLKQKVKLTKKLLFFRKVIASKQAKDVWKLLHRLLQPKNSKVNITPSELNKHYQTTASRILGSEPSSINEIKEVLRNINNNVTIENEFQF